MTATESGDLLLRLALEAVVALALIAKAVLPDAVVPNYHSHECGSGSGPDVQSTVGGLTVNVKKHRRTPNPVQLTFRGCSEEQIGEGRPK